MKHFIKIMAVCLAAALMMTFFAACAPSAEELAGTYAGSYVYNGNDFTCAIVINENGTYGKAIMKNGELSSSEAGDWEIKGNKVRLYTDDSAVYHGQCTEYKYKKGTLENNGHVFSK